MNKEAYVFIGLPGSGKSTYIDTQLMPLLRRDRDKFGIYLISADSIKKTFSNYDPNNPELVHEESVKKAEEILNKTIIDHKDYSSSTIVFDTGGINDNYSIRIINTLKKAGYTVHLTVIDTPVVVCLERVEKRERKVPYSDIFSKSFKMQQCINEQDKLVDSLTTISYYKNDYLFLDMDGVLAGFQVFPLKNKYAHDDLNVDYINNRIFETAYPVIPMLNKLTLNIHKNKYKEIFILSVSPNNHCSEEKRQWLRRYMPYISDENMYFVGSADRKINTLHNLMDKYKLTRENVLYVDDVHTMLWEATNKGINAIHPSMYLTEKY